MASREGDVGDGAGAGTGDGQCAAGSGGEALARRQALLLRGNDEVLAIFLWIAKGHRMWNERTG